MPWLIIVIGYLLGSLPTAYVAGRMLRGVDIRQVGDRNAGGANVFREIGPAAGIAVTIIDASKGVLAMLIAQAANIPEVTVMITGAAAVIGHNWPVFIGFRGGRGLSTTIGVLLTVMTMPMLVLAGPAALVLLIKRNVTLASAFLFIPLPLLCWWLGVSGLLIAYGMSLPTLVGITHYLRTRQLPRHA